ncbi:MAG: replication initiator protein A, partial [Abditibacteriota bacterium]|nr:replication initiator protein A [Abditibacteriota bacterium]
MTVPAYLDYCYGDEVKIDSFCRLPRILVTNEFYRTVPAEIKILYCLMLDRVAMSMRNGLRDKEGRAFIFFTIREAARLLNVGKDKATRLFKRMETLGLIRRRKGGLKRPDLIFVQTFVEVPVEDMEEASEETATDFAEADSVPDETPETPTQSEYVEQPPVSEEAATPAQIDAPDADTDSGFQEPDAVRNGLSDLLRECAASVRRLGDLLLGSDAPGSQTSPEQTSRRPIWGSLDCP